MLSPQQLQAAGSKMTTAASSGSLPPPSYASSPGGMTGSTLNNFVTGQNTTPDAPVASSNPLGNFLGGIVSAPATMVARPFQAAESAGELLGTDTGKLSESAHQQNQNIQKLIDDMHARQAAGEDVTHIRAAISAMAAQGNPGDQALVDSANYQPSSGGFVAPADKDSGDVKKDFGRAAQTVALGMGPVSGAGVFGAGDSVANGNNLLSLHTAVETATSVLGGKVLGIVGAPILGLGGKVVAKVTPQLLQDVAKGGVDAISNFANSHNILPQTVANAINGTADAAEKAANAPLDAVGNAVKGTLNKTGQGATDILSSVQKGVSKGNVAENLNSSVDRLASANPVTPGMTRPAAIAATKGQLGITNNPLDAYDKYFAQEQKFKGDAKEDTALGMIGSEVGNAYDKVSAMRRGAGATMGEEMNKIANTPIDISSAEKPLEDELAKNGITYDPETQKIVGDRTSKLSSQDQKMIENYAQELQKLGNSPTAKELDAFLSRVPNELDVYKNQNNIVKATNGERIIKGHLNDLAEQLKPGIDPETKAPVRQEFAPYANAKSDYASLSNFLKEGQGFLGRKTLSGDYAKDASLAKSSIQSALGGGKKDFLIKLEKLTGFPAIDHSMLAIQAMKDAGNFRGDSLLESLSPQSKSKIPLTKEGVFSRLTDGAVDLGKRGLVGTPNEQTRRIIQDQMEKLLVPKAEVGGPKTQNVGKQYNKGSKKLEEAFNKSEGQAKVGKFELGSFGKNSELRKTNSPDRFLQSELEETQKNVVGEYRANDNPKSYRYDNTAWLSKMPDGEFRVIYTRLNAKGNNEILNWHVVSDPRYIEQLKSFGTPSQS